jgi:hypothetical protein
MDTNEPEEKRLASPMTGHTFWHETELGRALAKRLPRRCTRVIIDIPVMGVVKIYYATVDSGPVLDLKWDDVIEQIEICKPKEPGLRMNAEQQRLIAITDAYRRTFKKTMFTTEEVASWAIEQNLWPVPRRGAPEKICLEWEEQLNKVTEPSPDGNGQRSAEVQHGKQPDGRSEGVEAIRAIDAAGDKEATAG